MTRRDFMTVAAAGAVAGYVAGKPKSAEAAGEAGVPQLGTLKVRFLGTGAADWNGRDERGELRRLSSVLLDGKVLIDYTAMARDMIPDGVKPVAVFYTHSHSDHYQPADLLALGSVKHVFVNASWFAGAYEEFAVAAKAAGVEPPQVHPMHFGQPQPFGGMVFTSLPANHTTRRPGEHCSMYLVEKGATRLMYATDTGGIMGEAAVIAGIDAHYNPGRPITALIMEATMGIGHDIDFRIYAHSSVETVDRVVKVLQMTKRYTPAPSQKVYLTHMARTLHGTHAEIAASAPAPIAPAYDGLEIML